MNVFRENMFNRRNVTVNQTYGMVLDFNDYSCKVYYIIHLINDNFRYKDNDNFHIGWFWMGVCGGQ